MSSTKRIFARRRTRLGWKILVALLAMTTTMAACAPRTAQWSPAHVPKKNQVDWIVNVHMVKPSRAGAGLSTDERKRLDQFANEIALGYGDQVVIEAPTRHLTTTGATLARYFEARRLSPDVRVLDRPPRSGGDVVTVIVGRYVVTPPKCPDWTKPAGADPANRSSSNFGCANTSNLGLMLADPGDLVRGREKGPSDGVAASRLLRRYRSGKVAGPKTVSSGAGQGGK